MISAPAIAADLAVSNSLTCSVGRCVGHWIDVAIIAILKVWAWGFHCIDGTIASTKISHKIQPYHGTSPPSHQQERVFSMATTMD